MLPWGIVTWMFQVRAGGKDFSIEWMYFPGGSRIPGLTYDQKLAEADKLYSSSAAAYMSDPRLCSSLRLPHPVDNKNGKDFDGKDDGAGDGGAGQLVVKEEVQQAVQGNDYVLSHGYTTLTNPTSSPSSLTYTLPEQQQQQPSSILYMYPGPDSPKVNFASEVHPASSGVSPPTLRLASPVNVLSLAGGEVARLQGDPSLSSSSGCSAPSSVLSTSCCTFSLSDFGAVSPIVADSSLLSSSSSLPLTVSEVANGSTSTSINDLVEAKKKTSTSNTVVRC